MVDTPMLRSVANFKRFRSPFPVAKAMFRSKKITVPPIPDPDNVFTMPSEEEKHEGTWLQWPHNCTEPKRKRLERYQEAWIQMAQALHTGERVHIIAYNETEMERIKRLLTDRGLDMEQVDFNCWPTNDVWVRDNGPIFCFDSEHKLVVTDWKFNGWGNKAEWKLCNEIPKKVAHQLQMPVFSIPMVNEGGSVELDGNGTCMAKLSSIINKNRNPGWTCEDAENYFRHYLGVTHFIWLKGCKGGDITDDHIDGTARFANGDTIVTFARDDFEDPEEYDLLSSSTTKHGQKYKMVHLPLTSRNIVKKEPGFYLNYYIGNEVIILPTFDDPADVEAVKILQELYPNRRIVPIEFTEVYKDGGMAHCVTQQQPAAH